jgi:hypothetical protein
MILQLFNHLNLDKEQIILLFCKKLKSVQKS